MSVSGLFGQSAQGHRRFSDFSSAELKDLYSAMVLPRLVEEKMLLLLRRGVISKWFSGIGQEAISIGVACALKPEEFLLPLHRNLGVFTTRGVPLHRLFAQIRGTESGFTKGRDRSFHFGTLDFNIFGMISHLGPQLAVADGIALAHRLRGEAAVCAVFCGDGGTSEGDFHEALNVAAVWDLPVIFVIENNGYGLSTPVSEQYRCKKLSDRAKGYGMEGITIDGNDVLTVFTTVDQLARDIREHPRPVLLECETFRMRGHEEASGTKYIPAELFEKWQKKDPIDRLERKLLRAKVLTPSSIRDIRDSFSSLIEEELEVAFAEDSIQSSVEQELNDVYAPVNVSVQQPATDDVLEMRFVDAISDALRVGMHRDPELVLMGQDVGAYGGVFKISEGFLEAFGAQRVRNTPLCESAIVGTAIGLSAQGISSVVEMQFADFVTSGFTQVVNNLPKLHYRWQLPARVVVRMPCGGGVGAGPFHSQSNEAWFYHTPGLKVVYPSCPADAKGLLLMALQDPNPVMFFEHKALYRSVKGDVPVGEYTIPFGEARVVQEGEDAVVVTYGMGVHWAESWQKAHPEVSLLILDLRTLQPLDYDSIRVAVEKTHRVLILHEASLAGGVGGDIASWIGEHCFESLDAPVVRCASLDTPVPFAKGLEEIYLANARLDDALSRLLAY
ncbi:MAG: dehydrogenase E1 component subunit alpha/beta [Bdellovibrionales bacterium]|nr:dehydrogenase E1 component subunit alpha/beta [Bdellovibrionales bacterium]